MLFKDACNAKSNQQNLGTIKSSNLCTEIVEYTAPDEVAVCNLASLNLSSFVNEADKSYDFQNLYKVTKVVTRNLNKVQFWSLSPSHASRIHANDYSRALYHHHHHHHHLFHPSHHLTLPYITLFAHISSYSPFSSFCSPYHYPRSSMSIFILWRRLATPTCDIVPSAWACKVITVNDLFVYVTCNYLSICL